MVCSKMCNNNWHGEERREKKSVSGWGQGQEGKGEIFQNALATKQVKS